MGSFWFYFRQGASGNGYGPNPVFWFSTKKEKIIPPITVRDYPNNLYFLGKTYVSFTPNSNNRNQGFIGIVAPLWAIREINPNFKLINFMQPYSGMSAAASVSVSNLDSNWNVHNNNYNLSYTNPGGMNFGNQTFEDSYYDGTFQMEQRKALCEALKKKYSYEWMIQSLLTGEIISQDQLSFLEKNSCCLYSVSTDQHSSGGFAAVSSAVTLGAFTRDGSGNPWAGSVGGALILFSGKALPKSFYCKPSAYPNYNSSLGCVSSIYYENGREGVQINNPPCGNTDMTGFSDFLYPYNSNIKSIYIRRKDINSQDVNTPLDFQGDLEIPYAVNDTDMVNLNSVNRLMNSLGRRFIRSGHLVE